MSVGNLNTYGDKKNNFAYQLGVLQQLEAIRAAIVAGSGADREFRVTNYKANTNGTGYSTDDLISRTDIIDAFTGTIISTLWFNETTGLAITPAPPQADLDPYNPPSTITVSNLVSVNRTPTLLRDTGPGTVTAGKRAVSFYNAGDADGVLLTDVIKPGETLTWEAGGQADVLTAITYDATGTELVIITTA